MSQFYDFFISHNSEDNALAKELYSTLHEINPSWNIFLDCSDEKPLASSSEWREKMLEEVGNSRYLIFLSSTSEYMKEGFGWLYEEVSTFCNFKVNRKRAKRENLNINYFGILSSDVDLNELYFDKEKGAEYRELYELSQHIFLNAGESICEKKEELKSKISNLRRKDLSDFMYSIIDKSKAFALKKAKNDSMFSKDAIIEGLLPDLMSGKEVISFESLLSILKKRDVAIVDNEGGSGKTTALLRLYFHYLNSDLFSVIENEGDFDLAAKPDIMVEGMVPIFVEAKTFSAKNHNILRYISANMFDETIAMSAESMSDTASKIAEEFREKHNNPTYLILIDGYNEIPAKCKKEFDDELKKFYLDKDVFPNVRVVLSGRGINNEFTDDEFKKIHLRRFPFHRINSYLEQNGINQVSDAELLKILSVPMYLNLYTNMASKSVITTRADLLSELVIWQQKKDEAAEDSQKTKALEYILLKHFLPQIAFSLMMTDRCESEFLISDFELEDVLSDFLDEIKGETDNRRYQRFYGREFREKIRESCILDYDLLDLVDLSLEYFEKNKLLKVATNGNYEFIHQIYRDFFCAYYISEQIKIGDEKALDFLGMKKISYSIREFVCQIIKETDKPFFDEKSECWNYDCNNSSVFYGLLDKIRNAGKNKNPILVSNVIEFLIFIRFSDLSNCDLSNLNLTESKLNYCILYRFDKNGTYSSDFHDSEINAENIFCEDHFASFVSSCMAEGELVVFDATRTLKFWNLDKGLHYPVKIIKNIPYNVYKIIYNKKDGSIIGMSNYEIIKIDIPAKAISDAETEIIFTSKDILKNIFCDDGVISYTTILNQFNPKPIDNPLKEDDCKFYGLCSAASVNDSKTMLACGHILGYNTLKFYQYMPDDTWSELKFGYTKILEDYITEIENKLSEFGLLDCLTIEGFDTDDCTKKRNHFFSTLQFLFEDHVHKYERVPGYILVKIKKRFEKINIFLTGKHLDELEKIAKNYEKMIILKEKSNYYVQRIAGKLIESVEFKKGENKLLLSFIYDYSVLDSHGYKSTILEMDLNNFTSRRIVQINSETKAKACYSEGKIIVHNSDELRVYNENGTFITYLKTRPKAITSFVDPRRDDTVYAFTSHQIYEFKNGLEFVNCFPNRFGKNIAFSYYDNGKDIKGVLQNSWHAISLSAGIGIARDETVEKKANIVQKRITLKTINNSYKVSDYKLVAFSGEEKIGEFETSYSLYVKNCNFKNVSGSLADEYNLKILKSHGAITDEISSESQSTEKIVHDETINHSDVPYFVPETVKNSEPDFIHYPKMFIAPGIISTNQLKWLSDIDTWSLINKGFYEEHDISPFDYSVLEWIGKLQCVTPDMIFKLIKSGVIEANDENIDISECLQQKLTNKYSFLYRAMFRGSEGRKGSEDLYTLQNPFGVRTVNSLLNRGYQNCLRKGGVGEVKRILIRNLWFCMIMEKYMPYIKKYSINNVFDTPLQYDGRARVNAYVNLAGQPIFVQTFRQHVSKTYQEEKEKIIRLCILVQNYKNLSSVSDNIYIDKKPILIFVGETEEHCLEMHDYYKDITEGVRILYTYDALLLADKKDGISGNYFEFVGDNAYMVDIEEFLR